MATPALFTEAIKSVKYAQYELELCFKKGLDIFQNICFIATTKSGENESNKFYNSYEKFIRKIELSRKKFISLHNYAQVIYKHSSGEKCHLTLDAMIKILEKNINNIPVELDNIRINTEKFLQSANEFRDKIFGREIESKFDTW